MINFLRVLLLVFLIGCGIPSFDYIDEAIISDNNSSGFTFKLDLEASEYITGFKLYSRYYVEVDDSKKFEDLDITETSNDSEKYLEGLGFTIVTIIDSNGLEIEEFPVSITSTFTVEVDPVSMYLEDTEYFTLQNNYKNPTGTVFSHIIGNYSDIEGIGSDFLTEFEDNLDIEIPLTKIYIEFAIINNGLSSEIEHIESLPIYVTPLELQVP